MEKNMAIAYQEEQSYIQDRLNGIETSLVERLAKHGYTIEEYQSNKDNYIFELLSPKIMDVYMMELLKAGLTSGDYILNIMNENNKHAMIFEPFLTNPIAMVGLKKEIYEDKCKELGIDIIYTFFSGGTIIEMPKDIHMVIAVTIPYTVSQIYFDNLILDLFKKYEPDVYKNNNDFMINDIKVGGTSLIEFKGNQLYGINISFEDASKLVSQVIPPRSIKPVGFANYSYRDNLKEDIINALHGVK